MTEASARELFDELSRSGQAALKDAFGEAELAHGTIDPEHILRELLGASGRWP